MVCLETCLTCTSPTFPTEPRIFSRVPKVWKKSQKVWYHLFWLVDLVCLAGSSHINGRTQNKLEKKPRFLDMAKISIPFFCTAWNEPKIALWNDWPRVHFVKKVGSYKMIRPPKNTLFTKWHGWPEKCPYKMPPFVRKMPLEHGSSHFIV